MNTLCYSLSLNVSAGLPSVSYTLSVVNDSSNTASLSEVNPINTLLLMTYLPFQNYSLAIKAKHVPHATASEILAELEWRVYTIWPSSILFSLCLESRRINGFTASATRGAIRLMCLSQGAEARKSRLSEHHPMSWFPTNGFMPRSPILLLAMPVEET